MSWERRREKREKGERKKKEFPRKIINPLFEENFV